MKRRTLLATIATLTTTGCVAKESTEEKWEWSGDTHIIKDQKLECIGGPFIKNKCTANFVFTKPAKGTISLSLYNNKELELTQEIKFDGRTKNTKFDFAQWDTIKAHVEVEE